jgi:hypothetical protein
MLEEPLAMEETSGQVFRPDTASSEEHLPGQG